MRPRDRSSQAREFASSCASLSAEPGQYTSSYDERNEHSEPEREWDLADVRGVAGAWRACGRSAKGRSRLATANVVAGDPADALVKPIEGIVKRKMFQLRPWPHRRVPETIAMTITGHAGHGRPRRYGDVVRRDHRRGHGLRVPRSPRGQPRRHRRMGGLDMVPPPRAPRPDAPPGDGPGTLLGSGGPRVHGALSRRVCSSTWPRLSLVAPGPRRSGGGPGGYSASTSKRVPGAENSAAGFGNGSAKPPERPSLAGGPENSRPHAQRHHEEALQFGPRSGRSASGPKVRAFAWRAASTMPGKSSCVIRIDPGRGKGK